ncbi:MAG: zinc-ribbon domain-containing protein [Eubacteriales bacterium]|nr:zinc-ribbon domain-containing protein [Eubacteriales bacterium]
MNYCVKCGTQVNDGVSICPQCGASIPGAYDNNQAYENQDSQYTYGNGTQGQPYTYDQSYSYDYDQGCFPEYEVKKNKGMAVLSYLGILVLIPILAGDKSSEYLKQHMNQGFVLFVLNALIEFAERLVDDVILIGGMLSWAVDVVDFAFLIIMIMGIISACKGTWKPLPIIGNVKIFK